jgi:hypothetical protein
VAYLLEVVLTVANFLVLLLMHCCHRLERLGRKLRGGFHSQTFSRDSWRPDELTTRAIGSEDQTPLAETARSTRRTSAAIRPHQHVPFSAEGSAHDGNDARQTGGYNDYEHDQLDMGFDQGHVAEEMPQQYHSCTRRDASDDVERQERAVAHCGHSCDHRGEGSDDGHESSQDDRLGTVALEEFV